MPEELQAAWRAEAEAALAAAGPDQRKEGVEVVPEQFLVLVRCRDEGQQVELLRRFQAEGLDCRALLS